MTGTDALGVYAGNVSCSIDTYNALGDFEGTFEDEIGSRTSKPSDETPDESRIRRPCRQNVGAIMNAIILINMR